MRNVNCLLLHTTHSEIQQRLYEGRPHHVRIVLEKDQNIEFMVDVKDQSFSEWVIFLLHNMYVQKRLPLKEN